MAQAAKPMEIEMALADFAPAARPSLIAALLATLGERAAARRIARARRLALNELLAMPEHRLRDLGIDPRQVAAAVDARHWPTRK